MKLTGEEYDSNKNITSHLFLIPFHYCLKVEFGMFSFDEKRFQRILENVRAVNGRDHSVISYNRKNKFEKT